MKKSVSSRNLLGTSAGSRACSTVFDGVATTLRNTHNSLPSAYRSSSLTVTGERLGRSDRLLVDRNGDKTTQNRTGSGSRKKRTDRENAAVPRTEICHRQRHRALDRGENEKSYGPRIHDGHGAREAKEQWNEGLLH